MSIAKFLKIDLKTVKDADLQKQIKNLQADMAEYRIDGLSDADIEEIEGKNIKDLVELYEAEQEKTVKQAKADTKDATKPKEVLKPVDLTNCEEKVREYDQAQVAKKQAKELQLLKAAAEKVATNTQKKQLGAMSSSELKVIVGEQASAIEREALGVKSTKEKVQQQAKNIFNSFLKRTEVKTPNALPETRGEAFQNRKAEIVAKYEKQLFDIAEKVYLELLEELKKLDKE
jgi:alpha-galactosidase/6-phospho-beta-glucosidase family protein